MALIKCPECGKEISSNAAFCPNCGNPVPKKMCPVFIKRSSGLMGAAVKCNVLLDGLVIGNLGFGDELKTEASVGSHNITLESYVNGVGMHTNISDKQGETFTIRATTNLVTITVKTKASWTGGVGKCIIDSIECR